MNTNDWDVFLQWYSNEHTVTIGRSIAIMAINQDSDQDINLDYDKDINQDK